MLFFGRTNQYERAAQFPGRAEVENPGDALSRRRPQLCRPHLHSRDLPLLREDLHATYVALGAIGSLFMWSYALGVPFAGVLADRYSRCRLIVFSLAAWSLIMTLCGLVTNVPQLLVLRSLLGFAECIYVTAAITLIADHHGPDTRATATGIHLAGLNFAAVVGGTMSGYLGDHFG